MRNASECRAKDPRTCPYHGAVIAMHEAETRMRKAGVVDPADLDIYFRARQKVEATEEEFSKHELMNELLQASSTPVADKPSTPSQPRQPSSRQSFPNQAKRKPYAKKATTSRKPPSRSPIVSSNQQYDNRVFPEQIANVLTDETGKISVFTRYDKAPGVPRGIMLGADRQLSAAEQDHLLGVLKYVHTATTRDDKGKVQVTEDDSLVSDHSTRSVYMKTQFSDASQLKDFHNQLNDVLKNGSTLRKDKTRKFEPLTNNLQVVAYYA